MPILETLGMQAAGAGLGGIMDILGQGFRNRQQYNQAEKLQGLQMQGNRSMMDYQMQKEYEMWLKTNYGAQVAQLQAAGLNPGLMYGMKGGGGVTTGSATAGVQGQAAPVARGMNIEAAMTAAQVELIRAQTEKVKAETPNVPLTGENIKSQTALNKNQLAFNQATFDSRMTEIERNIEKTYQEARRIDQDFGITDEMRNDLVYEQHQKALNSFKEGLLLKAQELNTKQQTEQSKEQVKFIQETTKYIEKYYELEKAKNPAAINQLKALASYLEGETRSIPKEIMEGAGVIGDVIRSIISKGAGGVTPYNPKKIGGSPF